MTSTVAMPLILSAIKRVHFVGIGGIGVSAIARMFLEEGKTVSGSDRARSRITDELAARGAQIYFTHEATNVAPEVDLVVYTIAVPTDNPELVEARRRELPIISYPQLLGQISATKSTVAVAGTHGKTTTTGMLAKIFLDAERDPTVIIGSLLLDLESNFVAGQGNDFIVEACEYRRSFLNLLPRIAVITNIDADHLDYYRDLAEIQTAFAEFAAKIPADGFLICDPAHPNLTPVLAGLNCQIIDYTKESLEGLTLQMPGQHNRQNAQAALAAARAAGLDGDQARQSLATFRGTWRRFELKGTLASGALLYDDYAHHPSEIVATLQGARERFPGKKLLVIFQPHLYSRTREHLAEFAAVLATADEVWLLPIYAAREVPDSAISSERLAQAINDQAAGRAAVYPDFSQLAEALLARRVGEETVVISMGAGDISELPALLLH